MNILRDFAKNGLFPVIIKLRLERVMRFFAKDSILNVMYHGVVEENSNYFSPRHITAENFEKHLKYLKANFDIISFPEAFKIVKDNVQLKRKTITISFDDGFKNNLDIALPLLEKYEIPTTFFISSMCITNSGDECIWAEWLDVLEQHFQDQIVEVSSYRFKNMKEISLGKSFMEIIKTSSYVDRDNLLEELISKYELKNKMKSYPEEIWKLLNKEEVIRLAKSKVVEIGSHGHLHFNLGNIKLDQAKEELVKSKNLLEAALGKEVSMIAFPDGSYNADVIDLAESVGYKFQLAVDYKNNRDQNDLRIMNRLCLSAVTTFDSNMIYLSKSFFDKSIKV